MEKIYFGTMNEAQLFLNGKEKIRDGVYLVDNKFVFKTYDEEYRKRYGLEENDLLKFKNLFIDGVSFIKGIIYLSDNYIYGTITEYVEGFSGKWNAFRNIPIDKLIIALGRFKKTIEGMSKLGIVIADPYEENIIFDGEKFTLIDTGECYYSTEEFEIVYMENLINIMEEIYNNIFSSKVLGEHTINRYLKIICSKYADFMSNNDYLLLEPEKLIIEIKEELENNLGIKIRKFGDLNEYLNNLEFPEDRVMEFISSKVSR